LPAIPVSPELTAVAVAHVRDLATYFTTDPNYTGADCAPHGWSSHGNWTGGCYKFADSSTWPIMWSKPQEIANYPGQGFEILAETMGTPMTASTALRLWAADPPHNDVIVNQGIWKDMTWQAMGVWVEGDWASVWFGAQVDPTPATAATANNAAAPQAGPSTPPSNANASQGQATAPTATMPSSIPAAPSPIAGGATPIASPVASPIASPVANEAAANSISNAMGNASGNSIDDSNGVAGANSSGNGAGNASGNGG
jgi:hypothetical protein